MRIALIGGAVIATLLAVACDGDDGAPSTPTETPKTDDYEASTDVERFVLVGGGPFPVCVQSLDESVSTEDVAGAVEAAFEGVAGAGHWPRGWDAPKVDRGCPLPPLALTETGKPFFERRVCEKETSGYLVHLYVGDGARFEERFADAELRVAPHEYLAVDRASRAGGGGNDTVRAQCFGWVSLAWYLTPEELEDGAMLHQYVANFVKGLH